MHGSSGGRKIPGRERIRNSIVYKKNLILLLIIYAGITIRLSAYHNFYPNNYRKPLKSEQVLALANKEDSPSSTNDTGLSNHSGKYNLSIPKPYVGFQIDLLQDIHPLPPYVSIDGIYKIDCVYIKGFEYFHLWETNKLNPYGFNGEHFFDSLEIKLYEMDTSEYWHLPLDRNIVTSDFGLRRAVWHFGVDIRVKTGDPVYAVFDGVVRITGYDRRGFGHFVLIRHKNGLETLYGHLSRRFVKLGQELKAGDIIGNGGNSGRSTAPHLHFEIRYSGNAIDPNEIFDFKDNAIIRSSYIIDHGSFAYLEEANKIRYHVIRSGDTLSGLSYRYGVSINKMCQLNGIRRSSILRIGQRVRIN
jgi:murein DD-endopeptidase MepM/ murein hydrolase activator NlpD